MIEKPTNFIAKPRLVKTKAYGLVSTLALVGMGMASPVYANETETTPTEAVVTTVATELNDTAEIQVEPHVTTEFIAIDAPVEGEVAPFENIEPYEVSSEAANAGAKYSEKNHPLLLVESVPTDNAVTTEPTTDVAVEESKNPTVFDKNLEDLEKGSSLVIDNGYTHFTKERPVTTAFEVSVDHDKDIVLDKEETERLAKEKGFSTVHYEEGKTVYVADKELLDTINETVNIPQSATGSLSFDALVSLKREIVEKDVLVPHVEYDPVTKTRRVMKVVVENGVEKAKEVEESYTEYVARQADYTIQKHEEETSEVFDKVKITAKSSNTEGKVDSLVLKSPSGKTTTLNLADGVVEFTPDEKGTYTVDYAISSTGAKTVDFEFSATGVSSTGEAVSGAVVGTKVVTRKVIEPYTVTKQREVIKTEERTRNVAIVEEYDADVEKIRFVDKEESYVEPVKKTRKATKVEEYQDTETRIRMVDREEEYTEPVEKTRTVEKDEEYTDYEIKKSVIESIENIDLSEVVMAHIAVVSGGIGDNLNEDKISAEFVKKLQNAGGTVYGGYDYLPYKTGEQEGLTLPPSYLASDHSSIWMEKDNVMVTIGNTRFTANDGVGFRYDSSRVKGSLSTNEFFDSLMDALRKEHPDKNRSIVFVTDNIVYLPERGLDRDGTRSIFSKLMESAKKYDVAVSWITVPWEDEGKFLDNVKDLVEGSSVRVFSGSQGREDILNTTVINRKEVETRVPVTKTRKVPVEEKYTENVTKKRTVQVPEEYQETVTKTRTVEFDEEYIDLVTKTRTIQVPEVYTVKERRTRVVEVPEKYQAQVKSTENYLETNYRVVDKQFTIDDRKVDKSETKGLIQSQEFKELNIENPDLYLAELPESGKAYTFVTSTKIKDDKGNGYATSKQVMVKTKPEVKEVVVEPKIEEPKKEEPQEVPSLEMKKTTAPEVAKKTENLQQVAAVVQMPQASVDGPKPTLPNTGESQSAIAVTGMTLLAAALGMTYSRKRA